MKKSIEYKNGNVLSYAECGDEGGYPVLVQHGLIATITDYHLFDSLEEAGMRVISIARPGYGESSPYCMANLAEWGDIVSALVAELRLPRFDVLGISSGAPYSYAIGYKLPDKVGNIFILSGIPALYDDRVLALWPYPVTRSNTIAELQDLAWELFFSNMSHEALQQDDVRDSTRNNCYGIALDFKLRCNNWGFALSDVRLPVYMQHSRTDNFAAAELTSRLLPNCRLETREGGDHFSKEVLDSFIKTTLLPHCSRPTVSAWGLEARS